MGMDEARPLTDMCACRRMIDSPIAERQGRIFGTAGDSVVAEFPSVASAVPCTVECQRRAQRASGLKASAVPHRHQ